MLLQTGTLRTLFAADAGQTAPPHVPLALITPPPASPATQSLVQATQHADENPRHPTSNNQRADRGNCPFLVRCKHPLLNGLQANGLSQTKIYVVPFQDERGPVKSGGEGSFKIVCFDCGTTIDALQLNIHKGVCRETTAQLGSQNPDGLRRVETLKEYQMNATDQMAINDPGLRNPIVNRNNLVDEAEALSQNEIYLTKLSYPLSVKLNTPYPEILVVNP
ncbi:hypothetical protein DAPPUDRAFT_105016 [Daphnia pulex]|uniref:Uncharacterized protein n=1 Tax=Daphnia pulex TaxID=6669 RepID=E9GP46_DAPPU|nr:hypothetical protein DAPPUDRAFT_105016 [Daphnia pulex]|eukprot:EFX78745.1 hypothetical protein DAPPUDRAFT_105016 [Daphnia pulex]